jgi:hypothetical protein
MLVNGFGLGRISSSSSPDQYETEHLPSVRGYPSSSVYISIFVPGIINFFFFLFFLYPSSEMQLELSIFFFFFFFFTHLEKQKTKKKKKYNKKKERPQQT